MDRHPTAVLQPKPKRSRNGCNECRRIHRRCDETKPFCQACLRDNKVCSYQRTLTWVGGSSGGGGVSGQESQQKRHPLHHHHRRPPPPATTTAAVVPTHDQPAQPPSQITALLSSPSSSSIPPSPTPFLPWLSPRHRLLVTHFAQSTLKQSALDSPSHRALCKTLLPLAIDSSHGFPLLAAILSVALTHRRALDLEDQPAWKSAKEARYWELQAVGHLRRLRLSGGGDEREEGEEEDGDGGKEREDEENLFAATALLLSHRESFEGGERVGSWRVHLGGAMAVLSQGRRRRRRRGRGREGGRERDGEDEEVEEEGGEEGEESEERKCLRKLGVGMYRVAQVFVRPSMVIWEEEGKKRVGMMCGKGKGMKGGGVGGGREKGKGKAWKKDDDDRDDSELQFCESFAHFETCDWLDETLGVSHALMHTLLDVRRAAADMTALLHMERAAGPEGMEPLWAALGRRVRGLIAQTGEMRGTLRVDRKVGLDEKGLEEVAHLNQAYYHIALSQINLHLMGYAGDSETVQTALANAMECLERIDLREPPCPGVALVQPAFAIGCYACSHELRQRAIDCLAGVKKKYGRGNAQKAKEFLMELWPRVDEDPRGTNARKLDLRLILRTPHRGEEYEWTDLMAEKGWDLSLW